MRKLSFLTALIITLLIITSDNAAEKITVFLVFSPLFLITGLTKKSFIAGVSLALISFNVYSLPVDFNKPLEYSGRKGLYHCFSDGKIRCRMKDREFAGVTGEKYFLKGDIKPSSSFESGSVFEGEDMEAVASKEVSLGFYLNSLKENIRGKLINNLGEESGALISSLILGLRDRALDSRNRSLKTLGIIHIISISGFHINLIEEILKKMGLKKTVLPFLFFYALLVGSPPAWRATLMKSGNRISSAAGRDSSGFNDLINAAIIQLLINPLLIRDLSFLLTYLSTAGIILVSPYCEELLIRIFPRGSGSITKPLSLTLGALIPTLPVIQSISTSFNPITLISNVVIVGLYTVYTLFSFGVCVFALVGYPAVLWKLIITFEKILTGIIVLSEYFLLKFRNYISYDSFSIIYYIIAAVLIFSYSSKGGNGRKHFRTASLFISLLYVIYLHPFMDYITVTRQFGKVSLKISSFYGERIFTVPSMYTKSLRNEATLIYKNAEYLGYTLKDKGSELPALYYKDSALSDIMEKENPVLKERQSDCTVRYLRTGNIFVKWGN